MYKDAEKSDFLMHLGDEPVTLTAAVTPLLIDASQVTWSCSDPTAMDLTVNGDGSCTLEPLAAVKGGVTVTAELQGVSTTCTVYIVP